MQQSCVVIIKGEKFVVGYPFMIPCCTVCIYNVEMFTKDKFHNQWVLVKVLTKIKKTREKKVASVDPRKRGGFE